MSPVVFRLPLIIRSADRIDAGGLALAASLGAGAGAGAGLAAAAGFVSGLDAEEDGVDDPDLENIVRCL